MVRPPLLTTLLLLILWTLPAAAQDHHAGHESHERGHATQPLEAPGQAIFGAVQEAIQALEADPETDWSEVDLEQLRRHLIDMHHVALNVEVVEQTPIPGGVRLVVEPAAEAAASLQRVLQAHPTMLQHEAGWQMDVQQNGARYSLEVTDPAGEAADKIRGLGYIGLLAYGPHHQHHHWMMARGASPHAH